MLDPKSGIIFSQTEVAISIKIDIQVLVLRRVMKLLRESY